MLFITLDFTKSIFEVELEEELECDVPYNGDDYYVMTIYNSNFTKIKMIFFIFRPNKFHIEKLFIKRSANQQDLVLIVEKMQF